MPASIFLWSLYNSHDPPAFLQFLGVSECKCVTAQPCLFLGWLSPASALLMRLGCCKIGKLNLRPCIVVNRHSRYLLTCKSFAWVDVHDPMMIKAADDSVAAMGRGSYACTCSALAEFIQKHFCLKQQTHRELHDLPKCSFIKKKKRKKIPHTIKTLCIKESHIPPRVEYYCGVYHQLICHSQARLKAIYYAKIRFQNMSLFTPNHNNF